MSGWLNKVRSRISPARADQIADAVEQHATEERVDSVLERAPGGQTLADKTPQDLNTKAGAEVRSRLGWKKPDA